MSSSFVVELDTTPPEVALDSYGVSFADVFNAAYTVSESAQVSADLIKGSTVMPLDITDTMMSTQLPSNLRAPSGDSQRVAAGLASIQGAAVDDVGNSGDFQFLVVLPGAFIRTHALPTGGAIISDNKGGSVDDNETAGAITNGVRSGDILTHDAAGAVIEAVRGGVVRDSNRAGDVLIHDASGEVKTNRTGGEPQ